MKNLKDKIFKNNLTGETVKVLDSFEDIAILEDKSRVDARHLVNPGLFTELFQQPIQSFNETAFNPVEIEEVKPENFFSNQVAYNSLADKIKNIPQHLIKDDPNAGQTLVRIEDPEGNPTTTAFDKSANAVNNESAIIQISAEDEKAALAAKYNIVNTSESVSKQNAAFAKLLGEDTADNSVQVIQVDRNNQDEISLLNQQQDSKPNYIQPVVEDPIIKMFKGVKRNLDFNVSINIDNKIPRKDFIEMMEDSYETSLIDFLADEFTNNIINDPSKIKEMIKEKINEIVYGKINLVSNSVLDSSTLPNLSTEKTNNLDLESTSKKRLSNRVQKKENIK